MLKAGLIGCGNISGAYLNNNETFSHLRVVKCANRHDDAARATAERFGLQAVSVDALFRDPELDVILNLTTPDVHTEIDLRALEAGKHIYSEKPFAITREDGLKVLRLASEKGLRVEDGLRGDVVRARRDLFARAADLAVEVQRVGVGADACDRLCRGLDGLSTEVDATVEVLLEADKADGVSVKHA